MTVSVVELTSKISKEKLELGKRAAKLGIISTIRYFTARPGEERTLSPSTLFGWKDKYLHKLRKSAQTRIQA